MSPSSNWFHGTGLVAEEFLEFCMNSSVNEQEEVVRRFDLLEDFLPVPLSDTGYHLLIKKKKADRSSDTLTSVLRGWPSWETGVSPRDSRRKNRRKVEDLFRRLDVGIEIPLLNRRIGLLHNPFLCRFSLSVSAALVTSVQCIGWEVCHPVIIRSGGYRMGESKEFPRLAFFVHIYRRLLKHCEDSNQEESYWFSLVKNSLLLYLRHTLYGAQSPFNLFSRSRPIGSVFQARATLAWSLRYLPQQDEHEHGLPPNPNDPDVGVLTADVTQRINELTPDQQELFRELDLVSDLPTFGSDPSGPRCELLPRCFLRGFNRQISDLPFFDQYTHAIRLAYNLLSSKAIMPPVPRSMVEASLEKHAVTLSKHQDLPLDPVLKHRLTEVGVGFGRVLANFYDPSKTVCPNRRATFLTSRSKGGSLAELQRAGVVSNNPEIHPRMEPLVVGLFGPPGSGKTVLVGRLVESLRRQLFPSIQAHDSLVYSRNPALRYWDGYQQQPIVVIDDFGQDVNDRSDIAEFDMLVSSNTFYPPMAALKSKGIKMTSPIIIVTSNLRFGSGLYVDRSSSTLDTYSVWRRFHLALLVYPDSDPLLVSLQLDNDDRTYLRGNHLPDIKSEVQVPSSHGLTTQVRPITGGRLVPHKSWKYRIDRRIPYDVLLSLLLKQFTERRRIYWEKLGIWRQEVCSFIGSVMTDPHGAEDFVIAEGVFNEGGIDISEYLYFPIDPPLDPPQARVCPILEPLKVRTITAGPAVSRVLKPLQMAMLKALSAFHHGLQVPNGLLSSLDDEDPDRLVSTQEVVESNLRWLQEVGLYDDEFYLSGDYESATDNVRMDVTSCLLEAILTQIPHEPTRRWAMWEVSGTRLHYPGGRIIDQCSGQLMGSILSFPLLCLINLVVSQLAGFRRFVINGDDLAAIATVQEVERWHHFGTLAGLVPNIGKYFVSRRYVWLNSQCFLSPPGEETRLLVNGKLSTYHRRGKDLCETLYEFQGFYPGEQNRSRWIAANREQLARTPRDPNVPRVFGGLARRFNPRGCFCIDRAKKVYSYYLNKKITPEVLPIPGTDLSILFVPVLGPRGFSFSRRGSGHRQPVMEDSVARLANVIRAQRWVRDTSYSPGDPDFLGLDDQRTVERIDLTWDEFQRGLRDADDVLRWVKKLPKISLAVPLDQFYFIPSIVRSCRSKFLVTTVRENLLFLLQNRKFKGTVVDTFVSPLDLFSVPDPEDSGLSDTIWENLVWTPEFSSTRRFDIVEDILKTHLGREILTANLRLLPTLEERNEGFGENDYSRLEPGI